MVKKVTKTKRTALNRIWYTQAGEFPKGTGVYEGRIVYQVYDDVNPSSVDYSTCFAREHLLVIQCEITFHKNIKLDFPISII